MNEIEKLEQAIAALEAQRGILGDAVVDTMLAPARDKLAALRSTAAPRPTDQQRKIITVLFADVSGFTAMSETMDAEEVSDTMNLIWNRLDAIITRLGGKIDKHLGDGVMALWGAEIAHEDDPERAIRAALAMQAALREIRQTAGGQIQRALTIEMRIGINTGPVLLGEIGTQGEFTALGDTVNLASRLQAIAPIGGILISHDTYRHVRGVFMSRTLDPVAIKGKAELVQVYTVERAKVRAFRLETRGVEGVETPTIGREVEMAQLQGIVRTVLAQRRLHSATIVGEAGIGKSRMLFEIDNWVDLLPETVWYFRGRITQSQMHLPYALLRDVFAFRFEILENDPPELARQKFEQGTLELMRANTPETVEVAHFIGHLLGLDFSESPYLRGILSDARQIRDRAYYSLARFFEASSRRNPIVLYLEDIHWADDSSLELLTYIFKNCQNLPMFVLCLARPTLFERYAEWGAWPDLPNEHIFITLSPLAKDATRELVEKILHKVVGLPQTLRELIVNSAEGNPFYVEELIKMFIDEHVILTDSEPWRVEPTRLADVHVPATLVGVIQARLDGLPMAERAVLQWSSVIGRIFWDKAVAHISRGGALAETAPEIIAKHLEALRHKELIFRREESSFAGAQEFTFKHVLVQEVTYDSILKRQRRAYHAQAATWLIAQSEVAGTPNEHSFYAGLIAEHLERADEIAQAAIWYGRAGDQARAANAPGAAIEYYRKALHLATLLTLDLPTQIAWYMGLASSLHTLAQHHEESIQAYHHALAGATTLDDLTLQAKIWTALANVQDSLGDNRAALESATQAEQLAERASALSELAHALSQKGWMLYRLGDTATALALGERALALSTQQGDQRASASSYRLLGAAHYVLGQHGPAIRAQQEALQRYRQLGDLTGERAMLNNLGDGERLRGDYEAAVRYLEDAVRLSRQIGNRNGELTSISNLGAARAGLGDYATAVKELEQVLAAITTSTSSLLAFTSSYLARAHLGLGHLETALEIAQQALAHARATETLEDIGEAWLTLGLVLAAWDDRPLPLTTPLSAPECFAECLQICTEMGAEAERAKVLHAWGDYARTHGDPVVGQTYWQEALTIFETLQMQHEIARMYALAVV